MEGETPSGSNQTCSGPEKSDGVRLMDQDVSPDYEIERFIGGKLFDRGAYKTDLPQTGFLGPLSGHVEKLPDCDR